MTVMSVHSLDTLELHAMFYEYLGFARRTCDKVSFADCV
jgi:hypothetical protein